MRNIFIQTVLLIPVLFSSFSTAFTSNNCQSRAHQHGSPALTSLHLSQKTFAFVSQNDVSKDFLSAVNDRVSSMSRILMTDAKYGFPQEKFDIVLENVQELVRHDGWTLNELIIRLNLEELGQWYNSAAVGTLLLTFLARSFHKDNNNKKESIPYPLTPETIPISYAITTKEVMNVVVTSTKKSLASVVSELSDSVKALQIEVVDLQRARAKAQEELATVTIEYSFLKRQLDLIQETESMLKNQIFEFSKNQERIKAQLDVSFKTKDILEEQVSTLRDKVLNMKRRKQNNPPISKVRGVWFANMVF